MKILLYSLLIISLYSCKKEHEKQDSTEKVKSEYSSIQNIDTIIPVKSIFKKDIANWEELIALQSLVNRFKRISVNEAFSNAKDLSDLTKSLKDSLRPEKFDNLSFDARINVFYNETLRLEDIATIEDITTEEAVNQIKKVLNSYSAINEKINLILEEDALEKRIDSSIESSAIELAKLKPSNIKEKTKQKIEYKKDFRLEK